MKTPASAATARPAARPARKHRVRRALLVFAASLVAVAAISQAPFVYRRYLVYPRTRAALDRLQASRTTLLPRRDGLLDLRGVIHSHSYLSHDSAGTPEEIIGGARRANVDVIFMTDHYGWGSDATVVTRGLRGEHGGVLFVTGAEMRDGVMPLFLDKPLLSYDPHEPLQQFIDDLRQLGAVVFLDHPDDPTRRWDMQRWTGMEIYNLHADARQSNLTLYYRVSEQFWSMRAYPMEVFHQLFHEPRDYLRLWDGFTARRRVVAIAGNDAHQNNGLRLIVSAADSAIVLTDTGKREPRFLALHDPVSRLLARAVFGPLAPGRVLWRTDADLYERSFHFVNTHLLAAARSEEALRPAVEGGHAYVAFDSLVDSTGFDFALYPQDAAHDPRSLSMRPEAIMGDEVPFSRGKMLEVRTPVSALIRLLRDGRPIREQIAPRIWFPVHSPGVYRVEVLLDVRGRLIPWIYSNPIYLR